MPATLVSFLCLPVGLIVCAISDRRARTKANRARRNLACPVDLDKFDRAAAHLIANDEWQEEFDIEWCASLPGGGIDWTRNAWSIVPMRAFDPVPHTYPRRSARRGSRNRLHRGF